jgi:hypothetical protein
MSANSANKNTKIETETIELLTLTSGYVLEVDKICYTNTDNIILKPILDAMKKDVLLCIDESFQCTWLNLTGTAPTTLLFFDEDYKFVSRYLFNKNSNGSYVISTAYKHILVLRNQYSNLKGIIHFKLKGIRFISNALKYKYLDFIPRPKFLDSRTFDLVDEDTFLEEDGRTPLILITQHGVFPRQGVYGNKPKHNLIDLEVFKHKTIGLLGMVYMSGGEYNGIIPCFVDDALIENLRQKPNYLNTGLWQKNIRKDENL